MLSPGWSGLALTLVQASSLDANEEGGNILISGGRERIHVPGLTGLWRAELFDSR